MQRLSFLAECRAQGVQVIVVQGPPLMAEEAGQLVEMALRRVRNVPSFGHNRVPVMDWRLARSSDSFPRSRKTSSVITGTVRSLSLQTAIR